MTEEPSSVVVVTLAMAASAAPSPSPLAADPSRALAPLPPSARPITAMRTLVAAVLAGTGIAAAIESGRRIGPDLYRSIIAIAATGPDSAPLIGIASIVLAATCVALLVGACGRVVAGPSGELITWTGIAPIAVLIGLVAREHLRSTYLINPQWLGPSEGAAERAVLDLLTGEHAGAFALAGGCALAVLGAAFARLRGRRIDRATHRVTLGIAGLIAVMVAFGGMSTWRRPSRTSYLSALPVAGVIPPLVGHDFDHRDRDDWSFAANDSPSVLHVRRIRESFTDRALLYWTLESPPPPIGSGAWDSSLGNFAVTDRVTLRRDASRRIVFAEVNGRTIGALREYRSTRTHADIPEDHDAAVAEQWDRLYVPISEVRGALAPPRVFLVCACIGLMAALFALLTRTLRWDLPSLLLAERTWWRPAQHIGGGEIEFADGTRYDSPEAVVLPMGPVVAVPLRKRGRSRNDASPYRENASPDAYRIEPGTMAALESRLGARAAARDVRALGVLLLTSAPFAAAVWAGLVV